MNKKEKIVVFSMVILFILSAGLFSYENFYSGNVEKKEDKEVLVATRDIKTNEKIVFLDMKSDETNKDINTDWKKVSKDLITKDMITKDKIKKNIVAYDGILEGEFLNIKKVGEKKTSLENIYKVNVDPHYNSTINKGDTIRVYVQLVNKDTLLIENFLIFDKKEVLDLPLKNEQSSVTNEKLLSVNLSMEESIRYYDALQLGNVIAIKYEDISELDKNMPVFNAQEWAKNRGVQ